jgi:hypothetical protein
MGAKGGHGSQALRLSPGRGRVHLAIRRWATYRRHIRVRSVPGGIRWEISMPDLTVVTPSAVVPADRLTLGATHARAWPQHAAPAASPAGYSTPMDSGLCMAEE